MTSGRRMDVLTLLCSVVIAPSEVQAASTDLLVASVSGGQVQRFDEMTGEFVNAFVPSFNFPAGLTYGPDGSLYVSAANGGQVVRFNGLSGAFQNVFVPDGSGGLVNAAYLVFGPDGNLYVSNYGEGVVDRYNGTTGAFMGVFSSGMFHPQGIQFGPDGDLFVSDSVGVFKFDGTTGIGGPFVTAGSGGLNDPLGVDFGPDSNLYVSSYFSQNVLRYNGSTGAFIDVFASGGGLQNPHGLLFGPDGNLYVSDAAGNQVVRYNGATGDYIDTFVTPGSGGLNTPVGLVFMPDYSPGDFDADLDVDQTDYLTLSTNLHTDVAGLTVDQSYLLGDMTSDLRIDGHDFRSFHFAYDEANGAGAFVAMLAGIPEPSTALLTILSLCGLFYHRRHGAPGRTAVHFSTSTSGASVVPIY